MRSRLWRLRGWQWSWTETSSWGRYWRTRGTAPLLAATRTSDLSAPAPASPATQPSSLVPGSSLGEGVSPPSPRPQSTLTTISLHPSQDQRVSTTSDLVTTTVSVSWPHYPGTVTMTTLPLLTTSYHHRMDWGRQEPLILPVSTESHHQGNYFFMSKMIKLRQNSDKTILHLTVMALDKIR